MLITNSQILKILEDSGDSFEQFATRIGLSGMTLRRGRNLPPDDPIPSHYQQSLVAGIRQLYIEGKISKTTKLVQNVISNDSKGEDWYPMLGLKAAPLIDSDVDSETPRMPPYIFDGT